ncbi:MAG: hypothetical protein KDB61_05680, partial [Planctomycetes bacterium]|nr:hypothetical protein [Planctomycetota bacterium]
MRWLVLAWIFVACSSGSEPGQEFALEGFRPLAGQEILLNEPLSLTFSRDLDPSSITPSNLRVEDEDGRPCAGEWRLQGRRWLRFWPRTVTGANLLGGGYRPGRRHVVHVVGFPAVGGLRALDGEPLDRCYRVSFQVCDPGPEDPAFLDFSPNGSEPLMVGVHPGGLRAPIQEGQPIRMWCAEPLDPRSLHSEDFSIWFHPWNARKGQPGSSLYSPVRVALVQNRHSDLLLQNEAAAILECTPQVPLDPLLHGQFSLRVNRDARLVDFGGHSPWPPAGATGPRFEFYFKLEPQDAQGQSQLRLEFLDRENLSSQEVPWADGEVELERGRLTVALPTCSGTGADGDRQLLGEALESDLHA